MRNYILFQFEFNKMAGWLAPCGGFFERNCCKRDRSGRDRTDMDSVRISFKPKFVLETLGGAKILNLKTSLEKDFLVSEIPRESN